MSCLLAFYRSKDIYFRKEETAPRAKDILIEAIDRETVHEDSGQRRTSSSSSCEEGTTAGSQLEQLRKRVRLERQTEVGYSIAMCALHNVQCALYIAHCAVL